MAIKYIDETDWQGKRVVARFDFNVPLAKDDFSQITDTTRIDRALPTIQYLLDHGVKTLVLMSHLGRPKGKPDPSLSLEPVAKYLAEKLGEEVILSESCKDQGIKTLLELPQTKIILLQNLRFHDEEKQNDPEFCRLLASYGDIFVFDAFGAAHRKHASTYGIYAHFKNRAFGGFVMKAEVQALSKIVDAKEKPFVAIVGGAKVSDKIKIIESLLTQVDHLLIGGAMAYPFLKAQGHTVGSSLCSDEDVDLAKNILKGKAAKKILLPKDHLVSSEFGGAPEYLDQIDIPEGKMGLDIGEQTLTSYREKLVSAKMVLWNGPMGLFENKNYSKGTFGIAAILADLPGFTVVGGGDSVSAVNLSGLSDRMNHVSTGGGASLEFIERGSLPGVQALRFGLS